MELKRPNKLAKGITKELQRQEKRGRVRITNPRHPNYNPNVIGLSVKGTLDLLFSTPISKPIQKEHPIDKGYFKKMYILNPLYAWRLKNATKQV